MIVKSKLRQPANSCMGVDLHTKEFWMAWHISYINIKKTIFHFLVKIVELNCNKHDAQNFSFSKYIPYKKYDSKCNILVFRSVLY